MLFFPLPFPFIQLSLDTTEGDDDEALLVTRSLVDASICRLHCAWRLVSTCIRT